MIHEKDLEDIICKYPELIEDGLILRGRQEVVYGRRMDLRFEDRVERQLIVELKAGTVLDKDIGQLVFYVGTMLSAHNPTARAMLVGTRVPPNIQRALDHFGIGWIELALPSLKEFLAGKRDTDFLRLFEDVEPIAKLRSREPNRKLEDSRIMTPTLPPMLSPGSLNDIIITFKASPKYAAFRKILQSKKDNEDRARKLMLEKKGNLTHADLKEVCRLVDYPYPYSYAGKTDHQPWFGRLLKPNAKDLLNARITGVPALNKWFDLLFHESKPVEKKLSLLQSGEYKIKGISNGFITLMLYVIDKPNYLIWFESLHEGLCQIYPTFERYRKTDCSQYLRFNKLAKEFASKYGFEHTEMDWLLSGRRTDPGMLNER